MNVTRDDLNDIHGEAGEPNIGADVFAALTCTGGCAPTELPHKPTGFGGHADKPVATRVITPFPWGSNNGARFRKKASVDGEQSVLHGHRRRRGVKGLAPDHDDSELYWWEQPQQAQVGERISRHLAAGVPRNPAAHARVGDPQARHLKVLRLHPSDDEWMPEPVRDIGPVGVGRVGRPVLVAAPACERRRRDDQIAHRLQAPNPQHRITLSTTTVTQQELR